MLAQEGRLELTRAAIEHGADVDAVDPSQNTPLRGVAAYSDQAKVIDMLVEAGASIESRSDTGSTPLHHAALGSSLEALLALLKHGADANSQNASLQTPLHRAVVMAGRHGTAGVVESLLRSDADETILNDQGKSAADVIRENVAEEDQLAEDVERVRQLLANAPADRAWRRRGCLVLCRAYPDRVQLLQESSSVHAGVTRRTRSRAKLARTEAGQADGRIGGNQAALVTRVLALQEEGIFRTIVGYL